MKGSIPKEPSPLALAIRANRERCVAESKAAHAPTASTIDQHCGQPDGSFSAFIQRDHQAERDAETERKNRLAVTRFPFLDGIPAADWLECREIERQMG